MQEGKEAKRRNRIRRGLYPDTENLYNADRVGAYNIMRKYCSVSGAKFNMPKRSKSMEGGTTDEE